MKNKIEDLRNHLFETLEMLKSGDKKMDVARAKSISDIAGRIIDTAKVEVDFLKTVDGTRSTGFIPSNHQPAELPAPGKPKFDRT